MLIETEFWDPNISEIRMTLDEYRDFQGQIQDQKREMDRIRQEHQLELMRFQEEAAKEKKELEQIIQNIEDNFGIEFDALGQEIDRLTNHLQQAQGLNENLKRICRERSNSARKVKPKKSHPGYLFISTQQVQKKMRVEIPYDDWKKDHPLVKKNDCLPEFILNINSNKLICCVAMIDFSSHKHGN